jgi:chemotaxis protein methyltransferase CheR
MLDPNGTNTTTYFFRESNALETVRDFILAVSAAKGRHVNIWCAGCSTGDEAYSLAIIAREALASVSILATDINPAALQHAKKGRYSERSLRYVSHQRIKKWFTKIGNLYQTDKILKRQIIFQQHDLSSHTLPHLPGMIPKKPTWDMIFCRNVLIYFDKLAKTNIISSMISSLAPQGLLILGAAEHLSYEQQNSNNPGIELINLNDTLLYRRKTKHLEERGLLAFDYSPPYSEAVAATFDPGDLGWLKPDESYITDSDQDLNNLPDDKHLIIGPLRIKGDELLNEGHNKQALATFYEAIKTNPLLPDLYLRAGICSLNLKEYGKAREALRRCLFISPNLWPAAMILGDLFADSDPQTARRYFSQAQNSLLKLPTDKDQKLLDSPELKPFLSGKTVALDAVRKHLAKLNNG